MTGLLHSGPFDWRATPTTLALDHALQQWDRMMELLPVGIYVCDHQGFLVRYNRRAAELWGQEPPMAEPLNRYCGAYRAYKPDGEPIDLGKAPMSEVLSTRAAVRNREAVLERPDGTRVAILANLEPLFDETGEIIGGVNCFQDISECKRIEALLRGSEQRHRAVLEAMPAAVYTTDADGRLTYFNPAAAAFWGYEPEIGKLWCGSHRLYWPDGAFMPHEECPMAEAIRTGQPLRGREAVAERRDGARVPFLAYPTPLRDGDGRFNGAVNVLVEISERKAYEEQLKLVMLELSHRSRNMLAVIQAMARRTSQTSASLQDFGTQFVNRLAGLAALHDLLAHSNWTGADLAQLVWRQVEPFASRGHVAAEGPRVTLRPEAAQAVAMALHELATNAAKHGALSACAGRVAITWRRHSVNGTGARFEVTWRESGGPRVRAPERRGFGYTVIYDVVRQMLDAEVELDYGQTAWSGGCSCRAASWPRRGPALKIAPAADQPRRAWVR